MEVQSELRKSERLVPEQTAFVAFRPEFERLGKITDISWDGLGCEYLAYRGIHEGAPHLEIDILLSGNGFYMSWISCKVIYDIQVAKDESPLNHSMESRRCGLQFWEMTEEKAEQLKFFLNTHCGSSDVEELGCFLEVVSSERDIS